METVDPLTRLPRDIGIDHHGSAEDVEMNLLACYAEGVGSEVFNVALE